MSTTAPKLERSPDADTLAQRVARWLQEQARRTTDRFSLALSGGSTPRHLYEILAEPPYRDSFPWDRTHIFWGDERFVPPDDKLSNVRMAREALLNHVPIPPENIHTPPHEGSAEDSAAAYQRTLQQYYGSDTFSPGRPLFDVTLLGLGDNGHTASLFPDTQSLKENTAWFIAVRENVPQPRLTLTYPAIAASRCVAFLVAGANKAAVLKRVLDGDKSLPASQITASEQLLWFVDAEAGKEV